MTLSLSSIALTEQQLGSMSRTYSQAVLLPRSKKAWGLAQTQNQVDREL